MNPLRLLNLAPIRLCFSLAVVSTIAILATAGTAHSQFTAEVAARFPYIQYGRTYYINLQPKNLSAVNNRVYFSGYKGRGGHEVFTSDGTPATSAMLKEIYVSAYDGSDPDEFTKVGNYVFFAATDGTNGRELWKTDGTAAGTVMVKNIRPGPSSSSPNMLIECQGKLVFSANDGANGEEIWVSDGTDAGTFMLYDIQPGASGSGAYNVFNWNGVVYFAGYEGTNNFDLWRTDGTVAGTYKLKEMDITSSGQYPYEFTISNGTLFFSASSSFVSGASELWKTDGTSAGTVPVIGISGSSYPLGRLTDVNGILYFVDDILSSQYGNELWRSDGTTNGTYMVKNINTSGSSGPRYLTNYNGTLYFVADDGVRGKQIWKSDGTSAGTVMVHEIYNGVGNPAPNPNNLVVLGGKLLFKQTRDAYGLEWWQTDGTPAGPTLVADIQSGGSSGIYNTTSSSEYIIAGNSLYFPAYDGLTGATELWRISVYVPPVKAQILTPANGTAFGSNTATFTWDVGTSVTSYALWIGSAPGGYDVYSGNEGVNLSKTVTTLPTDGRPLYVTLHSLINGAYQSNAYTYTAFRAPGPVKAQITSPVNGSTLGSTTLPLVWNAGTSVTSYYLFVGTTPGGSDLYAGDQGTALSRSVNVPAGGGKVHVTLWSLIKGAYQSNKYVFTTVASVKAALVGPTNGSTLTGNSLNLSWTAGTGVSRYYVYVGSSYGGYDIAAVDAGTANAWNFTVPQDGGPVYVTIWSLINGGFQANNYWFTTALPPSGNRPARITSPANASTLGSATMNLAWDAGSGASSYALWVGSTPDGYDLYSGLEGSSLSKSIPIPGDGRRIYVTLHSLISGAYQSNSYFFTAPTLPDGGAAQITSPANGSTLANSSLTLTWGAAAGATQYYLFAGSMPGGSDLYSGNQGTNLTYTLNGMPIDGRAIYVTLHSLINGVYKQSSTYYKTSNTASGNRRALITSPANGTTLPGAANTFTWGGASGATSYALWIGSSPGAYDLWSSAETLATTSRSVTLPTDGRKIHVALYSFISGAWQGASYIYTAANVAPTKAAMTSPVNGTTFTSASQTFNWSASNAATMYALWIGRSPGAYDIYAGAEGLNLSKTVTTLPTDGTPVYVTLYSLINGTWQSNEYIYQSVLVP